MHESNTHFCALLSLAQKLLNELFRLLLLCESNSLEIHQTMRSNFEKFGISFRSRFSDEMERESDGTPRTEVNLACRESWSWDRRVKSHEVSTPASNFCFLISEECVLLDCNHCNFTSQVRFYNEGRKTAHFHPNWSNGTVCCNQLPTVM